MDRLEHIARTTPDGIAGRWSVAAWVAGLVIVLLGGLATAAALLSPGLALAGSLPAGTANVHPWIADGGAEVARNMTWRIEVMLGYLCLGIAALAVALRFGRELLEKLQDWYEGVPLLLRPPVPQRVPAVMMPRPGHGRVRPPRASRKLHAA